MNRGNPGPHEDVEMTVRAEKPFIEHLEDLRLAIIKALFSLGAAFLICMPLTLRGYTISLFKRPLLVALARLSMPIDEAPLPTLYPAGGFITAVKISLEVALLLSLPFMLYFAGGFVLPALTKRERRYFKPVLIGGAMLFYAGIALCYFITLPWALQFFWKFNLLIGVDNLWTIDEYVKFTGRLLIAFGLVFEFPMVILFLVKTGILNYRILSEKRRYAIIIAFVLAAILTPPDVVTQVLMAVPLVVLYELCVWGARFMAKDEPSKGREGETASF